MSDISRVTQAGASMRMDNYLQADLSSLTTYEQEAASGKSVNQPSDNPTATSQVLALNAQIGRFQQYAANAQDGLSWLGTASSALSSATTALDKVQTDVLSGANASANDATSRQALAADVQAVKQQLLGLSATTYNGRYVFSGTYGTTPYPQGTASGTSDPTSASYNPAAAYAYAGSSTAVSRVVAPGQSVNVSMTGDKVFGSGSSSVFALLDTISQDLTNGNTSALGGADLASLKTAINTVTESNGTLGASTAAITGQQTSATNTVSNLQAEVGNLSNANEAQVATEFNLAQASYQAALMTTAKVIQPSLAQFLA
jgi:flagellar hook-associated protein 3 FlgL